MKRIIPFLTFLLTLSYLAASAQIGNYNIRLVEFDIDCDAMKYYLDIEIRASSDTSNFSLADQNYRFSVDPTQIANPQIETPLNFTGLVETNWPQSSSTFGVHNLTGSAGSFVSYNVSLESGDGFPLTHDNFVKVGRISFNLLDLDAEIKIMQHTEASGLLPATIITKNDGGILPAAEGYSYDLFSTDFNVYVFLDGAFDPATGLMSTKLNEYGLLPGQTPNQPSATPTPLGNPFIEAPWNHPTNYALSDYDPTVVDWVLISVRTDSTDSFLGKVAALLHSDGHIEPLEFLDWSSLPDPVYISVQTRSHMSVMSDVMVSRNCRGINYDFRFNDSYQNVASYGQLELTPGIYGMAAGDLDHNVAGGVDSGDNLEFYPAKGEFNKYSKSDLNLDGDVNAIDFVLKTRNNGIYSAIYE